MNFQTLQDVASPTEDPEVNPVLTDEDESFVEEKKKPQVSRETIGLVGVLVACGAVVCLMYLRNGPQSAAAAALSTDNTVTCFLNNGEEHVAMMRQALQNSDKVVEKFDNHPAQTQVPLGSLHANPFREIAASPTALAETEASARRRREQERTDVLKTVEAMQLQSVLRGATDACLIDNTLYSQGEQVQGFTIEEITNDSVIVRRGMYRFELRMGR